MANLVYPLTGRGAFPSSGAGGTLDTTGTKPGGYYRSPAPNSSMSMIGRAGFLAERDNTEVSVNDYAVFLAVKWFQGFFGVTADGLWGPKTDAVVKNWQTSKGLKADGVLGPATAKAIFKNLVVKVTKEVNSAHPELATIVSGHVAWESGYDPAAVGVTTPQDLGLGQINGIYHPDMSVEDRLNPETALKWIANFVNANLVYFKYNVPDAVASYNLGRGGASSWIRDGRPDVWVNGSGNTVNVRKYIDSVLAAA